MQKVTFINSRGEAIELYQTPFFLNRIEGLGDVNADVQSERAPGQDGSTYIDTIMEDRSIPIEVVILENLLFNRQAISRVFNPKLGPGLLVYENDISKWSIKAVSEHAPQFPDERPRMGQKAIIDLVCHDPYWRSEEQIEQLVVWEGGFEFPLQLPTEFARMSESKAKILVNKGDVETPVEIVFHGPATSPITIMNVTTGEHIEIKQSLFDGETLEINTGFGKKRVTINLVDGSSINAFHFITIDSSFFGLEQGNNLIDYSTGGDYERAGVTITWFDRYLGI